MGRKKDTISIFCVSEEFADLSPDQVKELEAALGIALHEEVILAVINEMDGWLMRFADLKKFEYGAQERANAAEVQTACKRLHRALKSLGPIAEIALDHFAYRHAVNNQRFCNVVDDLSGIEDYLVSLTATKPNSAAMQIQVLKLTLEDFGIPVTIAHDSRERTFNPSGFVKFVARLWKIEPRLRLYTPLSREYWPNLSQWISARLREPVDFESVRLIRRLKLD